MTSSERDNRPRDAETGSAALYNSRIIKTYLDLIKAEYPFVSIREVLRYAGMKPYEVADQGHWFTQAQINRFHEKLQHYTGSFNIARAAGRHGASAEAIGVMRQYVLGLVGPAKAYEMIGNTVSFFTRSSTYSSRRISSNKVEITATPNPGTHEEPFQCENRIGFFEAIATGFTNKLPHIEHVECMFKGGACCRYRVSWEKTASDLWQKITLFSAIPLGLSFLTLLVFQPHLAFSMFLPAAIIALLALGIVKEKMTIRELKTSVLGLRDSVDKLLEQIERNYNNTFLTNEIGQSISRHEDVDSVLESVANLSANRLDYDRGLILMANPERSRLEFRAGFGYTEEQLDTLRSTRFRLDRSKSKGVFVVSFRDQQPFLVNDINDIENSLSQRSLAFAKQIGAKSFICCPIINDDRSIGVLAVDNLRSKRPLVQSDMSLLMGISHVIGISIHNIELLEAKTRQFSSVLHVLAASIDARDSMTAGHSERVTEYAMGICQAMDLSGDDMDVIRVAALLHDYGKIGIPDAILKKAGKLTREEFRVVQGHAPKTREILSRINFEGIYEKVPEIAGAHHEKMDGSGYPNGLRGTEIPLGSRIIAVADFFEAITAKRHYREPMPIAKAFQLLLEESGRQFDEDVVSAFIKFSNEIRELRSWRETAPSDTDQGEASTLH